MEENPAANPEPQEPFRILVVDDELPILNLLRTYLEGRGHMVETAHGGLEAAEAARRRSFDLALVDLMMPDQDGLTTLKQLKSIDENLSVLIMTGYGTIKSAIEAMKNGAEEFLLKPLSLEALGILIERVRENRRLREECLFLRSQFGAQAGDRPLITRNKRMQDILDLIAKVAPLRSTVLIEGESGTGKELIARAIHEQSPRADRRFVAINCGVIPVHLLESELFGYERGAFTGAASRKIGYFEAAGGGTVLLDEIGEMGVDLQVKLLRVLQERSFQRVGGTEEIGTDVRIIASTNRNLEEQISQGRFRKDLYYRINVVRITVPPLRERPEDISLLAYHFLSKYAAEFGKQVQGIEPAVIEVLLGHRWEGNVRELENVLERAVAMAEGRQVAVRDLPPEFRKTAAPQAANRELKPFHEAKQDFEIEYLKQVLEKARGNISLAARLTDIPRQNLYEKLSKYGIDKDIFRSSATEM